MDHSIMYHSIMDHSIIVIYEGLYFDLAQGQMNGAPNETDHSIIAHSILNKSTISAVIFGLTGDFFFFDKKRWIMSQCKNKYTPFSYFITKIVSVYIRQIRFFTLSLDRYQLFSESFRGTDPLLL